MVSLSGSVHPSAAYPSHPPSPGSDIGVTPPAKPGYPSLAESDRGDLLLRAWEPPARSPGCVVVYLDMPGFQESREWGIAGVPTVLVVLVESNGWGGMKRDPSHLHSQLGVGGLPVKAAQEVKRVPAAPGRVATSATGMCKLHLLSAEWLLLFHGGNRPPGVEPL